MYRAEIEPGERLRYGGLLIGPISPNYW